MLTLIAQPKTIIKGKVLDVQGNILTDGSIRVASGGFFTTNQKSGFILEIKHLPDTLIVSYSGYLTERIPVNESTGYLNIVLKESIYGLHDVEVNTLYQQVPMKRSTGAYDFIDNNTLNLQVGTNILQRLKCVSSGVMSDPPFATTLKVSGICTISVSKDVLIN